MISKVSGELNTSSVEIITDRRNLLTEDQIIQLTFVLASVMTSAMNGVIPRKQETKQEPRIVEMQPLKKHSSRVVKVVHVSTRTFARQGFPIQQPRRQPRGR